RKSTKWKTIEVSWSKFLNKLSSTTRTNETIKEYFSMPRAGRDKIKDVGGFVGGALKRGRRKAENLANRSMLTLDMDFINTSVEDVLIKSIRSEEHTSELQSRFDLVCRLLLEKKKKCKTSGSYED